MRITNSMVSSQMILDINKNMMQLVQYQNQIATGKQIQHPSEDPIIAARTLQYESMLSELEQYSKNINQAMSWMQITESAIGNIENLLISINELAVQGASGDNTLEDLKIISTEMRQYLNQIGTELNASYDGRYVFSGYRTDEPMFYQTDTPNDSYNINQYFDASDIETGTSIQNPNPPSSYEHTVTDTEIIKLPYKDIQNLTFNYTDANGNVVAGPFTPTVKSKSDPDAYSPAPNEAYFIPETGELVLGEDVADEFRTQSANGNQINVNYDKTGFEQGEPNPIVYFNCTDLNTGISYDMDNQDIEYPVSSGSNMVVNVLGKDVVPIDLYTDVLATLDYVDSIELSTEDDLYAYYSSTAYANPAITDQDELDRLVEDHMQRERSKAASATQQKFSNLIGELDEATDEVSKQRADLGARRQRLDLIEQRTQQDMITYSDMLVQTNGVDIVEASIGLNSCLAIYQASLKMGASILQVSLINYI